VHTVTDILNTPNENKDTGALPRDSTAWPEGLSFGEFENSYKCRQFGGGAALVPTSRVQEEWHHYRRAAEERSLALAEQAGPSSDRRMQLLDSAIRTLLRQPHAKRCQCAAAVRAILVLLLHPDTPPPKIDFSDGQFQACIRSCPGGVELCCAAGFGRAGPAGMAWRKGYEGATRAVLFMLSNSDALLSEDDKVCRLCEIGFDEGVVRRMVKAQPAATLSALTTELQGHLAGPADASTQMQALLEENSNLRLQNQLLDARVAEQATQLSQSHGMMSDMKATIAALQEKVAQLESGLAPQLP